MLHTHTTLSHTGMALGDIDLHFAWQAWPLLHWAGSGGVLGPRWSPVTPQHFAGQAWHLQTSTLVLHGRHGTCWDRPSFCVAGVAAPGWIWRRAWSLLVACDAALLCVAGVALGDINLRFAWQVWHLVTSTRQVWHLWHWAGSGGAPHAALLCVAGAVIHFRFAWQAWYLVTSTVVLRDRRGTWWHQRSFCVSGVAGVALGDIDVSFAWQA